MLRDDLYITIPSFFRCPISLDVMKSPVSLCTGVTYDRASIQRWLDNGNNTCPATMQVLQSKDFVPNKTLQRLIKVWSDSVGVDDSVPSQAQIRHLIEAEMKTTGGGEKRLEFLLLVVRFASESEVNREFLVKIGGLVPMLVHVLTNVDTDVRVLEQVVMALSLILGKIEDRVVFTKQESLSSLLMVLRQGNNVESRIGCIKIIEFVSRDTTEAKLLVAEKEGFIASIIRLMREVEMTEACLSCLITISKPKRVKLNLVVDEKLIPELRRLLMDPTNTSVSITEKALKLLETVSSVKEGRVMVCEDGSCVQAVVHKVLKVSNAATEHAVTILWSLCYLFGDQRAQEAVTRSNGFTMILLLMQSNCSPAVRQMSADLLKIFRVNSKSCLSSYDTKTTHIMPF
ncbi:U-box domain-containing protein [Cephalotus follicularis]|uniref:U-box domain-containing protein n=1 Tax=Cephalotus follicularis TaxID=3775 RepID=A0A1Q3B426_CEPFO|nr:U-box domain-containing protein [Cephalotus follicularis]